MRDGFLKLSGLGVEGLQFLVKFFKLLLEVFVAYRLARGDSHVTARVEGPTLRFNFP